MPVTRIKNNQITDLTVNAASKLQDFSVTSAKIANNLTYDSNLTIIGNLTVQGNVTAIDTQNLVVEDPLILLAKDQVGVPSLDIGFIGKRGDELNIAFVWDESADRFVTAFTTSEVSNTVITVNSFASLQVLDLDAANVTITGNTSIGNITVNPASVIDMGNVVISNVADPVASNDAATKAYVDSSASSGFTIEDDTANTTVVSGGDTLVLLGTADQMTVLITDTDEITFGLTDNVTVQDNLTVTNTANVADLNASSNVAAGNAVITNDVSANTGTFTGNVSADTFLGNVDGTTGAFTGNVSGDTFLGNIDGATGTFTGNVSGDTFLGNIDGATGVFTGNVSGDTFLGNVDGTTGVFTGNVSGDTFLGNIDGATGVFTGNVSADTVLGNIDGTTGVFTGNISGGNISATGDISSATLETTGNVLIGGNLIVQGNITYINIDDLRVEDPIIVLGTGPNGAPLSVNDGRDRGVYMEYFLADLGNAFMGFQNSSGNMIIANDVEFSGNDVVQINSFGNLNVGNLFPQSLNVGSGNISAGNISVTGNVSADTFLGNIDGATGSFTGNVTADTVLGNIDGATGVFTGNVSADTFLGNVDGTTGTFTGNVSGDTFLGNIDGTTGTFTGNVTANTFLGNIDGATGSFTGNVTADTVLGNIDGATGVFTGNVSADTFLGNVDGTTGTFTGNVSGDTFLGNIDGTTGTFTGNVTANTFLGNIDAGGANTEIQFNDDDILNGDANFTFDKSSGQVTISGSLTVDNVVVNGQDITSLGSELVINSAESDINFRVAGDTVANLLVTDAGTDTVLIGTGTPTLGAALKIGTTDSFIVPVGNLVQRPGTPAIGMLRFSTAADALEVYGATGWEAVGATDFTVIVADQFSGDGSTVVFTLTEDSTTAATIVSINGVVQEPTTAYAVAGNVLTFTEAPAVSDNIDARTVTTTTTITGIRNISGNAEIQTLDTADTVQITGNVLPEISNVYNLGSSSLRWNELFLTGSTITLGNVVMKNTTGNSIGFFGPDGTTPGTVVADIQSSSIINGTSNVAVPASGGNVAVSVSGNANVGLFTGNGLVVTGSIEATGNIQAGNLNVSGIGAMTTLNVSGDSLLSGNLTVSGTTITANVSTVVITDPILGLGRGANGDPLTSNDGLDRGIEMFYFTDAERTAFMGFDNNAGKMLSAANVSIANSIVTVNSFGTTVVGTLEGEIVTATGNVTGGNLITAGLVSLSSIIKTGSNGVGNIGSSTSVFDTIFAKATSAQYADLAEMYEADAAIKPGTVVAFGGAREVTISYVYNDARVAGVVSTNPSYIMNSAQAGEHPVAVALTGRVPTCVTGVVRKGDMMVSAGDGTACACAAPQLGTVIGKALEDHDGESGMIEVVVGRV